MNVGNKDVDDSHHHQSDKLYRVARNAVQGLIYELINPHIPETLLNSLGLFGSKDMCKLYYMNHIPIYTGAWLKVVGLRL